MLLHGVKQIFYLLNEKNTHAKMSLFTGRLIMYQTNVQHSIVNNQVYFLNMF